MAADERVSYTCTCGYTCTSIYAVYRYTKFLRDALDPVYSRKPAPMIPNILELARTNLLLAESLKDKLLGQEPVFAAALDAGIQNGLSPAEKLAYQVILIALR